MDFKILDTRIEEENKSCFLCSSTLQEYIENLPDDYRDYEVQREIVTNSYLDKLIDTILNLKHIPPIVLVVEPGEFLENLGILEVYKFKILDGLQRTYRLKIIWDTITLFKKEFENNPGLLQYSQFQLSRKYSKELSIINSNSKILQSISEYFAKNETFDLRQLFNNNKQWFEIWTGLTPDDEVNKMLVLNAGHKPVKTKHQLELIFRNILPIIIKVENKSFELIREKEVSSIAFSKARKVGQFHFSQLIVSLLSLKEGKPITTNVNLVQKAQSTDFEIEEYNGYFKFSFIREFINTIIDLDKAVSEKFGDIGIKWIGREVSLVGLFSACGNYAYETKITPLEILSVMQRKICSNPSFLNLEDYEKVRNTMELSKVNIGNVNKNAIFNAISDTLKSNSIKTISWSIYFKA
jgi:hypothetical protein